MILFAFALALQSQTDQPHVKPAKEKKICRSVEKTGSMIPDSICHTAAEWKQIDQASGVDAQDMQRMQSQIAPH